MAVGATRRLATAGIAVAAAGIAAWIVACGLPTAGIGAPAEGGVSATDGSSTVDGGGTGEEDDGAIVPPACTEVDAACLGPLPSGWQPVGVTDGGCDPGFTKATLVTNPRVGDGGCACGPCQAIGTLDCEGGVVITSGDGCGDSPPLASGAPGACIQATAQHVQANPPQATGTIACFAANDAGFGAAVDTLGVCVPGCTADYCASASRCVMADGVVPCPSGFQQLALAGTSADPGCAPCACNAAPPGTCGGSVTVFTDNACANAGATYAAGTCNQFSQSEDFNSLRVDLAPPDASCIPADAGADPGDASLQQVRTICCQ